MAKLSKAQQAARKAWATMRSASWVKAHGGQKKVSAIRTSAAKKAWATMRATKKAAKKSAKKSGKK